MKSLILLLTLSCMVFSASAQRRNDFKNKRTSNYSFNNSQDVKRNYYNVTQLSFIIGETDEYAESGQHLVPHISTINGIRFNKFFTAGIGVGASAYEYMVYPLFLDLRMNTMSLGTFSPIVVIKSGYSMAFSKNALKSSIDDFAPGAEYKNKGGWMFSPELGIKTSVNEHLDLLFTVGYYFQMLESDIFGISIEDIGYNPYYEPSLHNRTTNANRVSFSIGFMFNPRKQY
ncbi:MAG: hypothetical protein LBT48_02060 [Prevotellaceae bacterium]|nr:hypothetical protein [Prevotellaceae bacterium]